MLPFWVHQETLAVRRNRSAEVISDQFMPIHRRADAEGGSEVQAQVPKRHAFQIAHAGMFHHLNLPSLTKAR